jgi:hypothetical protein
MADKKSW